MMIIFPATFSNASSPFAYKVHKAAFEFPFMPNFFKSEKTSTLPFFNLAAKKKELLSTISNTNNGKTATITKQKQVLQLVRELETKDPPPPNFLTSPSIASQLDGVWYLQYTSPSEVENDSDIEDSTTAENTDDVDNEWKPLNPREGVGEGPSRFNAKGNISAQGIVVDTSNKKVLQIIDIEKNQITNEVELDFGEVKVGGSFRLSDTVPNRVIVAFEFGSIQFNSLRGFTIRLDILFSILAKVRGTTANGWLETTFLSDDIRIGRGNKGTMFVLTRDQDAVQP